MLGLLRFFLIFSTTGFVTRYVFSLKRKILNRALLVLIFISIISSFFPLVRMDNQNYSAFRFALGGVWDYRMMLLGYTVAFIFLLRPSELSNYFSLTSYVIGNVFAWVGFFRHIPEGSTNTNLITGLVLFMTVIIPFAGILLYLPLVVDTKEKYKKLIFVGKEQYIFAYFLWPVSFSASLILTFKTLNIYSILTLILLLVIFSLMKAKKSPGVVCILLVLCQATIWISEAGWSNYSNFHRYSITAFLINILLSLIFISIWDGNKMLNKPWEETQKFLESRGRLEAEIEKIKEYWEKNKNNFA